jgi:hypothetical protein
MAYLFVGRTTNRGVAISSSNLVRWGAWAGMLGGLLWVLFPLGELPKVYSVLTPRGVLAYYSLGYLLPQLLMLVGLAALHTLYRRSYGWLGNVGVFVSFGALVIAFLGGAWDTMKIASTSEGSTVGYLTLIMGFFILAWGSGLLGLAITGMLYDLALYLGGLLLSIAVPLGLVSVVAAGGAWDFGYWAGLTVPYGSAWTLLGYALLSKGYASVKRPAHMS